MSKLSLLLLFIFVFFFSSCLLIENVSIINNKIDNYNDYMNEDEEQALNYLNKVRANPSMYSEDIGLDLSYVDKKHPLVWNKNLAYVAQMKAEDMAKRNYFAHVDPNGQGINIFIHKSGYKLNESWIKNKRSNNFESLGAGYLNGKHAIKELILDQGVNPPGHRNHLLGITDFWSNCYDIGIGFVNKEEVNVKAKYQTYICIIIANHDF